MFTHAVWLFVLFRVVISSKFGDDYLVTSHNQSLYEAFAYDQNTLCHVHPELRHKYAFVQLRRIDTFDASYPLPFAMQNVGPLMIDGCFAHNGHSFLWTHDVKSRDVLLVQGSEVQRVPRAANYEIGRYDYVDGTAYLAKHSNVTRYRFDDLLKMWRGEVNSSDLTPLSLHRLPSFYKDFFVVDGNIFFTSDNAIFKLLPDDSWDIVRPLPTKDTQYILFTAKRTFELSATIPSTLLYLFQLGVLILMVYCARDRLRNMAHRLLRLSPPAAAEGINTRPKTRILHNLRSLPTK
jgi:hypothetical protein